MTHKVYQQSKDVYAAFSDEEMGNALRVVSDLKHGDQVTIYFNDEYASEEGDKGYLMALPDTSDHELGNLIVFYTAIGEKGDNTEDWIHLIELCNLPFFERIEKR